MTATHRLTESGTFTCDGGPESECHQYPSCDCDYWDLDGSHEHPIEGHEECWMLPWVNATSPTDTSANELPLDECTPGIVSLDWDGDFVLWSHA